MYIDVGRSVTYAFEDPQWASKLIVFVIVGFVPGLNIILWGGYAISIARNIMRGEEYPLPAWVDWSDIAVRGLLSIVAMLLYFAPLLVPACVLLLGSAMLGGVGLALRCVLFALGAFYVIAASCLLGSGHLQFAQTDQFFTYLDLSARLRALRVDRGVIIPLFFYQSLLSFLLLMLAVVISGLFLFALSIIATASSILGVIVLILLLFGLVGFLAIVTVAFLANGYFLGIAGATLLERV
jgi:hypothetical protein